MQYSVQDIIEIIEQAKNIDEFNAAVSIATEFISEHPPIDEATLIMLAYYSNVTRFVSSPHKQ